MALGLMMIHRRVDYSSTISKDFSFRQPPKTAENSNGCLLTPSLRTTVACSVLLPFTRANSPFLRRPMPALQALLQLQQQIQLHRLLRIWLQELCFSPYRSKFSVFAPS